MATLNREDVENNSDHDCSKHALIRDLVRDWRAGISIILCIIMIILTSNDIVKNNSNLQKILDILCYNASNLLQRE